MVSIDQVGQEEGQKKTEKVKIYCVKILKSKQEVVSIHRPFGYEPNDIPLVHPAIT